MPEVDAHEPIIRVVDVMCNDPLGVDSVVEASVRGVPLASGLSRRAVLGHLHHGLQMIERVVIEPPIEARARLMETLTAVVVADTRPKSTARGSARRPSLPSLRGSRGRRP